MSDDPVMKASIHMPATLLARVQAAARATRTSVSEICRSGIASELRRIEAAQQAKQRAAE
jgi:predicted transcriptional regulator